MTTPEIIDFMDTWTLKDLAIEATKEGVIQIGSTSYDVILYCYRHYPDTLYPRRLDRVFGHEYGVEAKERMQLEAQEAQLIKTILTEPQNIDNLSASVLRRFCSKDNEFQAYIYSRKDLSLKIVDRVTETIESFSETDLLTKTALRELVRGNRTFLPLFSQQKLTSMMLLVKQFPSGFPIWLNETINQELAQRSGQKDLVFIEAESYISTWGSEPIEPRTYIKHHFLTKPHEVACALNKETLMSLAAEPEIHWSDYLVIAEALIKLGDKDSSKRYLNRIAMGLNMMVTDVPVEALFDEISKHKSRLQEISDKFRQELIKESLTLYDQIIKGEKSGNTETLEEKLKILGAKDQIDELVAKHTKELQLKFDGLFQRFKEGEKTLELKREFDQWLQSAKLLNTWGLRGKADEKRSLLGNQGFSAIGNIIGMDGSKDCDFCGINIVIDNAKPNALAQLQEVFYRYKFLGAPDKFYDALQLVTCDNPKLKNLENFDAQLITEHLINFLDKEFVVYIDSYRKDAHYKASSYNIKEFLDLNSLYARLGYEKRLQAFLPAAYQKLKNAALDEKARESSKEQAISKYFEIRKCQSLVDPMLEGMIEVVVKKDKIKKQKELIRKQLGWGYDEYQPSLDEISVDKADILKFKAGLKASSLEQKQALSLTEDQQMPLALPLPDGESKFTLMNLPVSDLERKLGELNSQIQSYHPFAAAEERAKAQQRIAELTSPTAEQTESKSSSVEVLNLLKLLRTSKNSTKETTDVQDYILSFEGTAQSERTAATSAFFPSAARIDKKASSKAKQKTETDDELDMDLELSEDQIKSFSQEVQQQAFSAAAREGDFYCCAILSVINPKLTLPEDIMKNFRANEFAQNKFWGAVTQLNSQKSPHGALYVKTMLTAGTFLHEVYNCQESLVKRLVSKTPKNERWREIKKSAKLLESNAKQKFVEVTQPTTASSKKGLGIQ